MDRHRGCSLREEQWRPLLVCNPQSCYYQWVLWIITEQVCEYITEPCPDPEP